MDVTNLYTRFQVILNILRDAGRVFKPYQFGVPMPKSEIEWAKENQPDSYFEWRNGKRVDCTDAVKDWLKW